MERRFEIAAPDGSVAAVVSTWGATLVSVLAPDRDGRLADVCLGFDAAAAYREHRDDYLGCTVGRVANRIAGARFTLDGVTHELTANDGPNHLHGGADASFDRVAWELAARDERSVTLRRTSPDGEEGYPGRLEATVRYAVGAGGDLSIELGATADRRTPVSLTNHAYWNLAGAGAPTVLDHELTVDADRWTPTGPGLIPTGEVASVAGTPYDLRRPVALATPIGALAAAGVGGFDDNLVLRADRDPAAPAAVLRHPASGRTLELRTDGPCLQVYTANGLGVTGKGGRRYGRHAAICLEPQAAPDAVNRPALDALSARPIVLEPGETYRRRIELRFSAR